MTTRDNLLRAIVADPDNPLCRYALADWDDEHGDDTAHMLRRDGYLAWHGTHTGWTLYLCFRDPGNGPVWWPVFIHGWDNPGPCEVCRRHTRMARKDGRWWCASCLFNAGRSKRRSASSRSG